MITQNKDHIASLKAGGGKLAEILVAVAKMVVPGVTTKQLNEEAERRIYAAGGRPSFKNYSTGSAKKFPASLCVSVNDEVVHGIPGERVLQEGDIVGLDIGMEYEGFFTDTAVTVGVGAVSEKLQKLISVTREALSIGIDHARVGGHVGDIGEAIQTYVEQCGFGVVRELVGHGVGAHVHEDPEIPNWGRRGTGSQLVQGMILALEPMITLGAPQVKVNSDGWVWSTADGSPAAHFEHTILLTKKGPEIITKI